ncbi:hypothetical protein ACFLS1_09690 [Verrucomicrobiota bacterium]
MKKRTDKIITAITILVCIVTITKLSQPLYAGPTKESFFDNTTVDKKDYICFAMYTVQNNTLKLTAHLYPLSDNDSRNVTLEIQKNDKWTQVAAGKIRENEYSFPEGSKAWNILFRVENWDHSKDWKYRVVALDGIATYTGTIRKDPIDKNEIVVAAFTGNGNRDRGLRTDIIRNIKAHNPDLLFFSGDQCYDHWHHQDAWLLFGRQFGEIIKDRPTISIPDDHDVGQPNLWGEEGVQAKLKGCADGGYAMPPQHVREVEFAQTANLPDPYDPTPIQRGIGVYYTSLNVGGIDFAIIEDRKFKTGPAGIVPKMGRRPDHVTDPSYDRKAIDVPEAKLLGERQLKFLQEWGKDWTGTEMKAVLSQTILAGGAHIHKGIRVLADLDSNGWPQTGRNKALSEIRKAFALMIAGDQHLATVFHHGIDNWDDAGFSFCVPSIVNYYPREWFPLEKGIDPVTDVLEHTGKYHDGMGNKLTMHAYSNPDAKRDKYGRRDKGAAGHGIIRFNKKERTITLECWPREVDVTNPEHKQYPGWPVTIHQQDNYDREAVAYLPTVEVKNTINPVIQIVNEKNGEIIYTLRIQGTQFRPKVFEKGKYTIRIQGPENKIKELREIEAKTLDEKEISVVNFSTSPLIN